MPFSCPKCGNETPDDGRVTCPECLETMCITCFVFTHIFAVRVVDVKPADEGVDVAADIDIMKWGRCTK